MVGGLTLAGAALVSGSSGPAESHHHGAHMGAGAAGAAEPSWVPVGHRGHRAPGALGGTPALRVKAAMVAVSLAVLGLGLVVAGTAGSLLAR